MELLAFTVDLSVVSLMGLEIGTKVEVISKETFYKEINSPMFRGIYQKPGITLDLDDHKKWFAGNVDEEILDKLSLVERVFYWTKDYKALYHAEFTEIPDSTEPPVFLRITRLDNNFDTKE